MVRTSPAATLCLNTAAAARCDSRRSGLLSLLAGSLVLAGLTSPAIAAREPSTRLIPCGEESCLLITGHRQDPASLVSLNGRTVAVEGDQHWRVRVPVSTVDRWSAPYARTIEVSLIEPQTRRETTTTVDLPIGLLGVREDLASLEIRIR